MKNQELNRELKNIGRIIQFLLPSFTLRKFKIAKSLLKVKKGRHSKELNYEEVYIKRSDGSSLRLVVYTPKERREGVPGLLWIHGGGYAIGLPELDEFFIKRFVDLSGCVVVSPDYTLSLDKPYPAAFNDCYDSLLWLRDNGRRYGMNLNQIFVGGDSAGGGLTAAVTLKARDESSVNVAFQMPLYPMLDDRITGSSLNNASPIWNSKSNKLAWGLYLGDLCGGDNVPKYAAPAREVDYSSLPPTCSFVGSIEPFVDENITYINNLREAGVPVDFRVFDGAFHAFDLVARKSQIAKDASEFLMDSFSYAVSNYFADNE